MILVLEGCLREVRAERGVHGRFSVQNEGAHGFADASALVIAAV